MGGTRPPPRRPAGLHPRAATSAGGARLPLLHRLPHQCAALAAAGPPHAAGRRAACGGAPPPGRATRCIPARVADAAARRGGLPTPATPAAVRAAPPCRRGRRVPPWPRRRVAGTPPRRAAAAPAAAVPAVVAAAPPAAVVSTPPWSPPPAPPWPTPPPPQPPVPSVVGPRGWPVGRGSVGGFSWSARSSPAGMEQWEVAAAALPSHHLPTPRSRLVSHLPVTIPSLPSPTLCPTFFPARGFAARLAPNRDAAARCTAEAEERGRLAMQPPPPSRPHAHPPAQPPARLDARASWHARTRPPIRPGAGTTATGGAACSAAVAATAAATAG